MTDELPDLGSEIAEGTESGQGWRRLHPLTIFKEIGSLAWAIVAALVLDFDPMGFPGDWVEADVAVAVAVFVYAVARYMFTAYRVTSSSLEVRRGVFVKSLQVMPRDRVQSVGATAGFLSRLLGVTTVEVSAADAKDVRLGFVSEDESEALRRILEWHKTIETASEDDQEEPAQTLAALPFKRLLVYAATETTFVVAVVALVVGLVLAVSRRWLGAPFAAFSAAAWPVIRGLALVGFRSWIDQDRVRIQAGIIGRRQSVSPLDRIQLVQVRRPPLRRFLGLETVTMVTGDIGVSAENVLLAGSVAPLVRQGTWRRLAERLLGPIDVAESALERSSPLAIRRAIVRGFLLLVPLAVGVGWLGAWAGPGWWAAAVPAGLGSVIVIAYARARWRVLGWALDDRHLMVRRGVVDRRLMIVPVHKVQDVTVRSTPFQHRLGLANVEVDTAGIASFGVLAVDLPAEQARHLADRLAETAARIALPDGV